MTVGKRVLFVTLSLLSVLCIVTAKNILVNNFSAGITRSNLGLEMTNSPRGVSYDADNKCLLINMMIPENNGCDPWSQMMLSRRGRCANLKNYDLKFKIRTTPGANFSLEIATSTKCCKDRFNLIRYRYPITITSNGTNVISIPLKRFRGANLKAIYGLSFTDFAYGFKYYITQVKFVDRRKVKCSKRKHRKSKGRKPKSSSPVPTDSGNSQVKRGVESPDEVEESAFEEGATESDQGYDDQADDQADDQGDDGAYREYESASDDAVIA